MASLRNNREERSTADRLLDAARESILSVGWKRTTLTDVAGRAGVSRMTVYRTYPDMPTLFGDLMTCEWTKVIAAAVTTHDAGGDWPDQIASRLVGIAASLRENDVFRRIVDVDPDLLLPYLLDRRGRSQEAGLDLLSSLIAEGQAEGGLREGDPVLLARTVVLATHGFVLSAHTMTDHDVTPAALDQELAELVRRCLTP